MINPVLEVETSMQALVCVGPIKVYDYPPSNIEMKTQIEIHLPKGIEFCEELESWSVYNLQQEKTEAIAFCKNNLEKQLKAFGIKVPNSHKVLFLSDKNSLHVKVSTTWDKLSN